MWASKRFLEKCEKLRERAFSNRFEEGSRLARGFADLGSEEFLLLPGRKLLSLFSGSVTELLPDHEKHFFLVPSSDDLISEIVKSRAKIAEVKFVDEREWHIVLISKDGREFSSRSRRLDEALLDVLILLLEVSDG